MMTAEVRDSTGSFFESTTKWGVALLHMREQEVREHHADRLRKAFIDAADRHDGRVILNVAGLVSFNCSWINTLLALSTHCVSKGGGLFITGLSPHALGVLRATGLISRFNTSPSTEHALGAMGLTGTSTWRMAIGGIFKRKVA